MGSPLLFEGMERDGVIQHTTEDCRFYSIMFNWKDIYDQIISNKLIFYAFSLSKRRFPMKRLNGQKAHIIQMLANQKQLSCPIIAGKYLVGPMIGKGAFGSVYLATVEGQQTLYALKKQQQSVRNPQLMFEYKVLRNFDKVVGFPKVYWAGQQDRCSYMVFQLLGPSLEDLFCMCDKSFSLKTVLMLADQMLHKIQHVHTLNYVHRDLKPQNFLIGLQQKSHIVYLVDFGLCRRYRDVKTHQHIPYKQNKSLTGTVRYSSVNTHFGIDQSRRDDLEAIGFILVYFMNGYLPWQGVKANNKNEKHEKIQQKKLSMPIEVLCRGLPIEFSTYLNYCRTLKFEEKPDYKFLRKMFRELFDRVGYTWDFIYDWCDFQAKKQIQTPTLSIKIEKKGEEINQGQLNKEDHMVQFVDCVDEDDIGIRVANISKFRNGSDSENAPDDSLMEEDVSHINLVTSKKSPFKLLQDKNANIW